MASLTQSISTRGHLKIFLGYAAGVGKTYKMLEEAQALKRGGHDIVIGFFEPHGREATAGKAEGLEIVPPKRFESGGVSYDEMDTSAILSRRPEIAVVDEFAHSNPSGRSTRWENVMLLLQNGIDVYTTLDIQNLESLTDQIEQMSGVRVRDTIPDWVVARADEVVMVDVTPRALLHRLERGVVYGPDETLHAEQGLFRESILVALRELALRQAAHEVDIRHVAPASEPAKSGTVTDDRVLAVIIDHPSSAAVIRRAKKVADYLRTDCLAVYVQEPGSPDISDSARSLMNFARQMQLDTRVITGKNMAEMIVGFARAHRISQIFVSRANYRAWDLAGRRQLIHHIVHTARDMQVTIVAERGTSPAGPPA